MGRKIGFFKRNRKKLFYISLFTIVLMVVALTPGIGYEVTVKIAPRGVIGGGEYGFGRLFNGTIQASFNPLLYPISQLSRSNPTFRRFTGASEFWDHEGQQVVEMVIIGTLFAEITKNIPYFLTVSYLITLILGKLITNRLARKPRVLTVG